MKPDARRQVHVEIGSVVLRGVRASDRRPFMTAFASSLQAALSEQGALDGFDANRVVPSIRGGTLNVPVGAAMNRVGALTARHLICKVCK